MHSVNLAQFVEWRSQTTGGWFICFIPEATIKKLSDWCDLHCKGKWEFNFPYGCYGRQYFETDSALVFFESEEDAVYFKLKWIGK